MERITRHTRYKKKRRKYNEASRIIAAWRGVVLIFWRHPFVVGDLGRSGCPYVTTRKSWKIFAAAWDRAWFSCVLIDALELKLNIDM